ncbi:PEPxxWA-CTERM sorting domain-containing protein [Sphingomonas lutea]|uniref:PEPxxWA-CTERM sorting domain-containing protein n=1 Tax=Sphingomonas lutea TaxID=1045317 RepID=A0A7G9SJ61_9SPHN|nr:PEPxxWA-CTERM sorting domain-containing protein [Sphingomonas lutea]QNN67886.1 PEPxxWA-CTERM sorting domain-containing protein [Sphingomonas lutea]
MISSITAALTRAAPQGVDYGIRFTNANFDSTSQYTQPTFGITSSIAYMLNSPLMFTADTAFTSIAFDAFFFGVGNVVNVWSGANGTGTLLASQTFGQNCTPTCLQTSYSMFFANALSVTISPNANGTGLDNLRIGSVPEPATWAMMLLGFGAIGYRIRRRRRVHILAGA